MYPYIFNTVGAFVIWVFKSLRGKKTTLNEEIEKDSPLNNFIGFSALLIFTVLAYSYYAR